MISASRSYQNNVEVMNTAKSLLLKTLQIGQCMSSVIGRTMATSTARRRSSRQPVDDRNEAGSADRFLKLLVAQMQNQDPLNPMDNAQITSQMAQINTVSGIDKLNGTVEGLNQQFVQMQALQGAALVGRDVMLQGDHARRGATAAGSAASSWRLRPTASRSRSSAPAGHVVDTIDLGAQGAGRHGFDWPARDVPDARPTASASPPRAARRRAGDAADARPRRRRHHRRRHADARTAPQRQRAYGDIKAFN